MRVCYAIQPAAPRLLRGAGCGRLVVVEKYGPVLGVALLLAVLAWAYLLARQAARNVDQFREEHHESFLGGKKP